MLGGNAVALYSHASSSASTMQTCFLVDCDVLNPVCYDSSGRTRVTIRAAAFRKTPFNESVSCALTQTSARRALQLCMLLFQSWFQGSTHRFQPSEVCVPVALELLLLLGVSCCRRLTYCHKVLLINAACLGHHCDAIFLEVCSVIPLSDHFPSSAAAVVHRRLSVTWC